MYFFEGDGSDGEIPVFGDASGSGCDVILLHFHCFPHHITPVPLTLDLTFHTQVTHVNYRTHTCIC